MMTHRAAAALLAAAGLLFAGCQTSTMSEYAVAGVRHTEPLEFNGQRYQVTFVYSNTLSGFDVQVDRPGRPLGGGDADRDTSIEVARSAITHFACATGQRAAIVDGSPAFTGAQTWSLQAKCAA
jgi:hypothetical protein